MKCYNILDIALKDISASYVKFQSILFAQSYKIAYTLVNQLCLPMLTLRNITLCGKNGTPFGS